MKPKAIIFDLFGVLASTFNQKWREKYVADRPEVVKDLKSIMAGLDIGTKVQADFFDAAAKAVGRTPQEVQQEMESSFTVYPDMFALATQLRKEYKTAICSNASAPYARALFLMKGYELNDYFDKVFISSELTLVKPDAEMFIYCAKNLGVELTECAFVDDAEINVAAAEKLGMKAHLFTDQNLFESWLTSLG